MKKFVLLFCFIGLAFASKAKSTVIPVLNLSSVVGQPVTMEMVDFREGGEGVAYHDLDPQNKGGQYRLTEGVDIQICDAGGFNVCYGEPTEWLEYSINVPVSGLYSFEFFAASPNNAVKFYINYASIASETITVPMTGGWQTWQPGGLTLNLVAGVQNIRFNIVAGGNFKKAIIKRILEKSHIATLSNISVGGVNLIGFSPSVMSYDASVLFFYPVISTAQTDNTATSLITFTNDVASIVVTAADGTTKLTYTLKLLPMTLPSVVNQPITLLMENFNSTEGVGYHDLDPQNKGGQYRLDEGVDIEISADRGYNISYGEPTEWLNYTINVPVAGKYNFKFYVSSQGNDVKFYLNYTSGISETITVPMTGGWQIWQPGSVLLNLLAGVQTIRFNIVAGGNFDKAIITREVSTSSVNSFDIRGNSKMFPSPAVDVLNVTDVENAQISVFTIDGKIINRSFNKTKDAKINVANFKSGCYIIRITKDNLTTNSRFIVK